MRGDRSWVALGLAIATLALLVAAHQQAWLLYDFSTGRQTAPDGPYQENFTVEHHMAFYATHTEGDVEPSETEQAEQTHAWLTGLLFAGGGLTLLALLGNIRYTDRIVRRIPAMALHALSGVCLLAAVTLAWFWIPDSMAGMRVTEPFTSTLHEPDGYTQTTLWWGWVWAALGIGTSMAAVLAKYQAGDAGPHVIESYRVT